MSEPTIRKYVRDGDLARGVLPLAADALLASLECSETVTTVEYSDEDVQANGRHQLARLDRVIALAFAKLERDLVRANGKPTSGLRLTDCAKACQIRQQLAASFGKQTTTSRTATVSGGAVPAEFADKSADELGFFADNERWPSPAELEQYATDRRASLPESHIPPPDPRDEVWPKED